MHFKSETRAPRPRGRRAFNRGETERVYTAGAGVGLHCPQGAGRIIPPHGRQVAHASSSVISYSIHLLRMPRTFGVPMSSARTRDEQSVCPEVLGGGGASSRPRPRGFQRNGLAPPPPQRAQAQRGDRGACGAGGADPPRSCRSSGGSWVSEVSRDWGLGERVRPIRVIF